MKLDFAKESLLTANKFICNFIDKRVFLDKLKLSVGL